MDRVAPFVPPGLGFVRLGNFMNSELLGRPTDMGWGVIFPSDPLGVTRHPSQLYQAFGTPDHHIGFIFEIYTRGQLLCLPMIVIGVLLIYYSYRKIT